jgi:hypothetical protein
MHLSGVAFTLEVGSMIEPEMKKLLFLSKSGSSHPDIGRAYRAD